MKKLCVILLSSLMITGCAVSAQTPTQTKGDTHYANMDLVKDAKDNKTDPTLSDINEVLVLDTDKFNAKLDRIDIGETTVKTNYLKAGDLGRIIVTLHDFKDPKAAFEEDLKKTGLSIQRQGDVSYFIEEPDNGRMVTLLMDGRYISLVLDKNSPIADVSLLISALKVEMLNNVSAQTVVENHFKYKDEKNQDKILTTLTDHWKAPNVVWGFEHLDQIKLIRIEEDITVKNRGGYLSNGRGRINGTTGDNLKVFKVKYEVKYKDEVGPQESGTYDWWYFVIRKDGNSPWLIDDMGV